MAPDPGGSSGGNALWGCRGGNVGGGTMGLGDLGGGSGSFTPVALQTKNQVGRITNLGSRENHLITITSTSRLQGYQI